MMYLFYCISLRYTAEHQICRIIGALYGDISAAIAKITITHIVAKNKEPFSPYLWFYCVKSTFTDIV